MIKTLGIAVPSLNQAPYVADAIASLRRLTVPFTAIVQDAGSNEETLKILRAAIDGDGRIELVIEPDDGQADAINRAWSRLLPTHEYLTWLNTDDLAYPKGVAEAIARLDSWPRAAMAYGSVDRIDAQGAVIGSLRAPRHVHRFRLVHHNNIVPGILPIIRASALRRAGPLDPGLDYAMDHDLFIRLAEIGELRGVPVAVGAQRHHQDAKTERDREGFRREIAEVRERHRRLPRPLAGLVRLALRAAWWPMQWRYVKPRW